MCFFFIITAYSLLKYDTKPGSHKLKTGKHPIFIEVQQKDSIKNPKATLERKIFENSEVQFSTQAKRFHKYKR